MEYRVDIKTRSGLLTHRLVGIADTGFLELAYVKEVNKPGLFHIPLGANCPAIADLELDSQIEIWYKDPDHGIDWFCDFYGFYRPLKRYPVWEIDQQGREIFHLCGVGQLDILRRRLVAYPAA